MAPNRNNIWRDRKIVKFLTHLAAGTTLANPTFRAKSLMPGKRWFLELGALLAIIVLGVAWRHAGAPGVAAAPMLPAGAPQHAPLPQPTQAQAQAGAVATAAVTEAPLSKQIDDLLASHDAEKAWAAYWLVADCASFNTRHDRLVFDSAMLKNREPDSLPGYRGMNDSEKQHDAKLCAGMTERQRQSRLDYLALALQADVPGSAVAFANEGPFGDPAALDNRPDDPLVQQWKAQANAQLARQAESGVDVGVLHYLMAQTVNGSNLSAKDPALAYRYGLAIGKVEADLIGPDNQMSQIFSADSDTMTAMAKSLSSQQRAAEQAAAERIAEHARQQRKHGADKS